MTDGDTIKVLVNRTTVILRLYGVDCPEKRQPYGTRAKQFTATLVLGVEVEFTLHDRDRSSRYIASVVLPDGRILSDEIVKWGFGWWFRRYAPDDTNLRSLEEQARQDQRGLWADPGRVAPWEWRSPQKARQRSPR